MYNELLLAVDFVASLLKELVELKNILILSCKITQLCCTVQQIEEGKIKS